MNNFDHLKDIPGVTHMTFCSLCSAREATGTVPVELEPDSEETFPLPVCELCVEELDKRMRQMLH